MHGLSLKTAFTWVSANSNNLSMFLNVIKIKKEFHQNTIQITITITIYIYKDSLFEQLII